MKLGPLYHWSPRDRRASIQATGLDPRAEWNICAPSDPEDVWADDCRVICLSPSPQRAWLLSGDFAEEYISVSKWDLWQVELPEMADVRVRPEFGPIIQEIKCRTLIPPDHVWWVGERPGSG